MCISKISKAYVKLTKDVTVKKILKKRGKNFYHGGIGEWHFHKLKSGINKAIVQDVDSTSGLVYDSGFHCYENKISNESISNAWGDNLKGYKIFKFTIPKGTIVTYGIQANRTVIVTPILVYKGDV